MPCLRIPLSNASSAVSRPPSHGSGPGWLATPSLYDSFIRDSTPVYPGAIHSFAMRQPAGADNVEGQSFHAHGTTPSRVASSAESLRLDPGRLDYGLYPHVGASAG